jgi:hypothetical protein
LAIDKNLVTCYEDLNMRGRHTISIDDGVWQQLEKDASEAGMSASRLVELVFKVAQSKSSRKVERILDGVFASVMKLQAKK